MPFARLAATLAAFAMLQGCTLARTIVHNGADLDDHRIFANRTIPATSSPSPLRQLSRVPEFMARLRVPDEHGTEHDLERYLEDTRTAAFVVMRDDRVVYERYSRGFDGESLLNSFSIAKSIVATLVGIAVSEGRLDLDRTVASYRPDFADTPYGAVTLRRLLAMTSGLANAPSYLPGAGAVLLRRRPARGGRALGSRAARRQRLALQRGRRADARLRARGGHRDARLRNTWRKGSGSPSAWNRPRCGRSIAKAAARRPSAA